MPHTDYIKKGKPQQTARKTPSKRRSSNTRSHVNPARTTNNRTLQMAIAILVISLSAFIYFLTTIHGSATDDHQSSGAVQPKTPSIVKTPSTAADHQQQLPDPPMQEEWQYINELKSKEVEVETTKIEKKGPYLMQCATFKDARRAEAFKAQLALLGFESRIKTTQGTHGVYHRVQLGPYEKNRDAQAARHKLTRHKINGCKIWLWS